MIAYIREFGHVDREMLWELCRRDFDFDFVQCLDHDVTELFCRRKTGEFERNVDADLFALFKNVKVCVQNRARDRVELHIVNKRILVLAGSLERDNGRLTRLFPDGFELAGIDDYRGSGFLRTVEDRRRKALGAECLSGFSSTWLNIERKHGA